MKYLVLLIGGIVVGLGQSPITSEPSLSIYDNELQKVLATIEVDGTVKTFASCEVILKSVYASFMQMQSRQMKEYQNNQLLITSYKKESDSARKLIHAYDVQIAAMQLQIDTYEKYMKIGPKMLNKDKEKDKKGNKL